MSAYQIRQLSKEASKESRTQVSVLRSAAQWPPGPSLLLRGEMLKQLLLVIAAEALVRRSHERLVQEHVRSTADCFAACRRAQAMSPRSQWPLHDSAAEAVGHKRHSQSLAKASGSHVEKAPHGAQHNVKSVASLVASSTHTRKVIRPATSCEQRARGRSMRHAHVHRACLT